MINKKTNIKNYSKNKIKKWQLKMTTKNDSKLPSKNNHKKWQRKNNIQEMTSKIDLKNDIPNTIRQPGNPWMWL